jgi:hypothetical protein
VTFGSGVSRRWLGTMSCVFSNQNRAMRVSTSPLKGMVVSTRSNALNRSVATRNSRSRCR